MLLEFGVLVIGSGQLKLERLTAMLIILAYDCIGNQLNVPKFFDIDRGLSGKFCLFLLTPDDTDAGKGGRCPPSGHAPTSALGVTDGHSDVPPATAHPWEGLRRGTPASGGGML